MVFMDELEIVQQAEEIVEITIEELQKNAIELLSSQEIQEQKNKVEQEAKNFLNQYKLFELMKKRIDSGMTKTEIAKYNREKELEYVRTAFFNFQNALNEYFNQQIKVLFVYHKEDGTPSIAVYDNNIKHLAISNYGGLMYSLGEISVILNEKEYDATKLNDTEKNIQIRWQEAKEHIKINGRKKTRFLPILWKINGKWSGAKVNNLGTIAEAYTKFYINHFDKFTNNLEQNICIFIRHPYYGVASVDNAPGLLIGDIDNISALNLAVKKETASPMNMNKVKKAVEEILKSGSFDPEKMKTLFVDEVKSYKNQMSKLVGKELNNTIETLLNKSKIYSTIK